MMLVAIDPWILAFSAVTVIVTIWMGFRSAKTSKTASDFFVAGRSVSVGWNASAISGEYLSAASFMGVAGMVMSSGYDALWYPVCYACGYLFLLLFIAGPLRRFGAYTIPDFAEGRFDSPLFRKIAVIFVLFIGFFYTMPQMKGAGTTLSYIFPGLPYWAGVVLVGAVITLNVALGGMKGITLVQAFQYWAKMFAISVPIFVLMTVYGHYGKQVGANDAQAHRAPVSLDTNGFIPILNPNAPPSAAESGDAGPEDRSGRTLSWSVSAEAAARMGLSNHLGNYSRYVGVNVMMSPVLGDRKLPPFLLTSRMQSVLGNGFREILVTNGIVIVEADARNHWVLSRGEEAELRTILSGGGGYHRAPLPPKAPGDLAWLAPFGPLTTKAAKAAGSSAEESKPYSLLYTYSLIIALVCGTAGLPHILVRFYTNPDGVAAKRTTMWVMILIGVFYLFPPVFGVMGRNLMPSLYEGTGAKGTDKVVLELPRLLNESRGAEGKRGTGDESRAARVPSAPLPPGSSAAAPVIKPSGIPWGSILSGITCAGAFAAFMSTFSGLLVSMTGAMAHDVYGRILRPQATAEQRLRAFKIAAVGIGAGAMLLGFLVESFEINKMVGWAFAIAATSYFPLLFLSTWWRGITMKGAATGMLAGGTLSLLAIASTMFADQAAWAAGLKTWYAAHPLWRILAEQPAIWGLPLALGLMYVVSKLTAKDVPSDIRMKMLVLHAPEKLGLKQEYIQEHQQGH